MKPDTFSFARSRGDGGDRKTLQLCSQVADTLNYVLSGECDDELLRRLASAVGRLRSEIAASITRKKAPELLFQIVLLTG